MTLLASSKWYQPKPEAFDPRILIKPLPEVEKAAINSAMILCEGNMCEAARRLGISRATIYRKLAQYKAEDAEN